MILIPVKAFIIPVKAFIIATLIAIFLVVFTKIMKNGYSYGRFIINIVAMLLMCGIYYYNSRFVSSPYLGEALNTFCIGGLIVSALALLCGVCFLVEK